MRQEDLTQEILQRIDLLAAKLGTTAEYLWPELVRREFAEGITMLTLCGFLAVAALWLGRRGLGLNTGISFMRRSSIEDTKQDQCYLLLAAAGIAALAAVFLFGAGLPTVVAPGAYALERLLN